jgi:hypothetical protein
MKQKTKHDLRKKFKDIPREKGSYQTDVWIVLLCDLDDKALYLNKSNGYFSGFEVHKIRTRPARKCNIHGKMFSVPDRRVIASNNEFGRYAWSYPSLKMVFRKHPEFMQHERRIKIILTKERVKLDGGIQNNVL